MSLLHEGFINAGNGTFELCVFEPWLQDGLVHGFIGCSVDFSAAALAKSRDLFKTRFGLKHLFLLRQVHGADLVTPDYQYLKLGGDGFEYEGDGWLLQYETGRSIDGFGVRTADCVPVIIRSGEKIALVHAGWRGLAKGIVGRAVALLASEEGDNVTALIGPCAGENSYQVGREVVEAIGETAAAKEDRSGSFYLSLPQTVVNQIAGHTGGRAQVYCCGICTINNTTYHSFRRDGQASGRNLSFVAI